MEELSNCNICGTDLEPLKRKKWYFETKIVSFAICLHAVITCEKDARKRANGKRYVKTAKTNISTIYI